MILVSACLLGLPCRYDGTARRSPALLEAVAGRGVLALCPERLGGLPCPRPPVELCGGDGVGVLGGTACVRQLGNGAEATGAFLRGAARAVALARGAGVVEAWLKGRSPSCGVGSCTRDGALRPGPGVAAAALARAGVPLVEWEAEGPTGATA